MTMKKNWYLLSGILFSALIVLIIIVEHKGNYYKATPEEVHKLLLDSSIVINSVTINIQKEPILIICLSENVEDSINSASVIKTVLVKPEYLLKPENRKLYKNHSGTIVLQSDNLDLAANAWVLLTRLGYKNIKIWNSKIDDKLNYTFQPDSLVRLK